MLSRGGGRCCLGGGRCCLRGGRCCPEEEGGVVWGEGGDCPEEEGGVVGEEGGVVRGGWLTFDPGQGEVVDLRPWLGG